MDIKFGVLVPRVTKTFKLSFCKNLLGGDMHTHITFPVHK